MAELRPFPPSPRRRALARQAGLHAASPALTGGLACAAALVAIAMVGGSVAARLGGWLASAARLDGGALQPHDLPRAVLELAAPVLAACAIVALVGHLAQTRAAWLPRRRIRDAPAIDPARTRNAAFDLAAAAIIGAVAFGWLWLVAPRLAALTSVPLAAGLAITSAAASFAIAWVAIGVFDALVRYRDLALALQMTPREKREDERVAGADPRWRRYRARVHDDPATQIAGSTLLVLGDDLAVAIAWDPLRRPIPTRTAIGRAARATQLLGLARRHQLPVHRDPTLARALGDRVGPVPEARWARLAEIVAAVQR